MHGWCCAVASMTGKIAASLPLATIKQASIVVWGGHPSGRLWQPEWAVAREIAAPMVSCVCCHCSSGGWFFVAPPSHETVREEICVDFFIGMSKFKTIASHVVGIQHTSIMRLRYDKIKNVVQCHTFWGDLATKSFCCIMMTSVHCHFKLRN